MKKKYRIIADLLWTFLKIGLFTFGGGYAMIALVENICVTKKEWITHEEMANVVVIAESTPGPIAINCSTYVGYRQAGTIGALVATTGVVIPSFVVIMVISMFLDNFLEITVVANAFKGIKIAVGILILNAAVNMMKHIKKEFLAWTIFTISCIATLFVNWFSYDFSSTSLLLIAGSFTFVLYLIKTRFGKKGGKA